MTEPERQTCRNCKGSGIVGKKRATCHVCKGSGAVVVVDGQVHPAPVEGA